MSGVNRMLRNPTCLTLETLSVALRTTVAEEQLAPALPQPISFQPRLTIRHVHIT